MAFDTTTLDTPFAALAGFDWGGDAAPLAAIDAAVVAAHSDAALARDLEKRLGAIVSGPASRAAKDYACRKLALVGTQASVPVLAPLLGDPDESHMARFAIERIPGPEAAAALRQALGTVRGDLVIGMISSLANRRDGASVPPLSTLVSGESASVAAAAAAALGRIATPDAAAALAAAAAKPGAVAAAVIDARLACADALVASGERTAARAIYEAIAAEVGDAPRTHRDRAVRIAARSGVLACLDDTVTP
jgi:HEAT repeat protein